MNRFECVHIFICYGKFILNCFACCLLLALVNKRVDNSLYISTLSLVFLPFFILMHDGPGKSVLKLAHKSFKWRKSLILPKATGIWSWCLQWMLGWLLLEMDLEAFQWGRGTEASNIIRIIIGGAVSCPQALLLQTQPPVHWRLLLL